MPLAGRSRFDWKTKCQQAVEEPPFGRFETCPCQLRLRSVDIGDHVVERTRETEWALTVDRDRPVAHIVANIVCAEPVAIAPSLRSERREFGLFRRDCVGLIRRRIEGAQYVRFREIGEAMPASLAESVFEEQNLTAVGAGEQFHAGSCDASSAPAQVPAPA
jgi:hypothetical protein